MYKRVLGYFKRYEYPENITVILSQLYTLNGHVHLKKGVRDMSVIFFNVFYMQHYNGSEEGLEGGFNFDSVDANGDIVAGKFLISEPMMVGTMGMPRIHLSNLKEWLRTRPYRKTSRETVI